MPIMSKLTRGVRSLRPVTIVYFGARRTDVRRSNPAERGIARALRSGTKRLALSCGLILATLVGAGVGAAPALAGGPPPVSLVREWGGLGSSPGQFDIPWGVATDGSHVYVADFYGSRVQEFAYGGKYLLSIAVGSHPEGVALDSAGDVYVSTDRDTIDVYTATGAYIRSWGSLGRAPGEFWDPRGLAVDGAGNVYVADCQNNRVQKFTGGGALLQIWGGLGTSLGQFNCPSGVAVDGGGNLYVADTGNSRVEKLTSGGTWISWGSGGAGPGYFAGPQGIAVDRFGNVFVADTGNNRAQQFDSNGTFLQSWGGGSVSTAPGQFDIPYGVAVISTPPYEVARGTTIYLTQTNGGSTDSDRVQEFWEGTSLVHQCPVCVTVPNLYGTFEREARTELASLGLNVSEYTSVNTQVGCNDVFSQSPAAGTSVLAGSTVTLGLADNPNDPGGCF